MKLIVLTSLFAGAAAFGSHKDENKSGPPPCLKTCWTNIGIDISQAAPPRAQMADMYTEMNSCAQQACNSVDYATADKMMQFALTEYGLHFGNDCHIFDTFASLCNAQTGWCVYDGAVMTDMHCKQLQGADTRNPPTPCSGDWCASCGMATCNLDSSDGSTYCHWDNIGNKCDVMAGSRPTF